MSKEKRKTKRYRTALTVYWERPSGSQLVQLVDISRGGCLIRTLAQPSVNAEINLEILFPGGRWRAVCGFVVRCVPGQGFAVCFRDELESSVLALIEVAQSV